MNNFAIRYQTYSYAEHDDLPNDFIKLPLRNNLRLHCLSHLNEVNPSGRIICP